MTQSDGRGPHSPKVRYVASVMCADLGRLADDLRVLEQAGCHELHFDVMDGAFVPNITLGFNFIDAARRCCKLPCAAHLMVVQPERYIDRFIRSGCDTVTIHVEADVHPARTLVRIREAGAAPGIALNPATPLSKLDYLLESVDRVLVMTVDPGYAGQRIITSVFRKVDQLKQMIVSRRLSVAIEVDGNINLTNAKLLMECGADILVLGTSSIFDGTPLRQSLEQFHKLLSGK